MLINFRSIAAILVTAVIVVVLAGCRGEKAAPLPTRIPAPTFTPTTTSEQAQIDAAAIATANALAESQQQDQSDAGPQEQVVVRPEEPTPTNTTVPPTPVPQAEVIVNTNMNVRNGPGTNYGIVGSANSGERYPVQGKNDAGSWWQIDFQGQLGWVFNDLVTAQNTGAVAVAQNIPAPPPTQPPPPTNTPVPAAPAGPAPTPAPSYQFNKALLQRCDPNAGVTYVHGTTYRSGQPANGYQVAYSWGADAAPVAVIQSGPHQGYEGWNTGYYSHIIGSNYAREGDWYFWIVDDNGNRISAIAHVHTDGEAGDGKCQQAVIDFDS